LALGRIAAKGVIAGARRHSSVSLSGSALMPDVLNDTSLGLRVNFASFRAFRAAILRVENHHLTRLRRSERVVERRHFRQY
jgi:hypothetical protein